MFLICIAGFSEVYVFFFFFFFFCEVETIRKLRSLYLAITLRVSATFARYFTTLGLNGLKKGDENICGLDGLGVKENRRSAKFRESVVSKQTIIYRILINCCC